MENQLLLLTHAREFASNLILTKVSKSVKFHTLQHTEEVVAACERIADHEQVAEEYGK